MHCAGKDGASGTKGGHRDRFATMGLLLAAVAGLSCNEDNGVVPPELACGSLDAAFLADGGVGQDGIPALTDPEFVPLDAEAATSYLTDGSRVIGVRVGDEWLAVPHNLMYRHEVVNLNRDEQRLVVTYCPLTGSALAFDRSSVGDAAFGVSGLLFQANLIMYDRTSESSLWPQMAARAACGPKEGQRLTAYPVIEMTWAGWKQSFPNSAVVGVDLLDAGTYRINPYGSAYEAPSNADYLGFPIPRNDTRRSPKERVLGFPALAGEVPLAFPFHAMEARGDVWSAKFEYGGEPAVVLWDGRKLAAVGVRPVAGGQRLSFRVEDDMFVDNETGSRWSVAGEAVFGPLTGERLPLIAESYVAFWQAWAAFHPNSELLVE